MPPPPRGPTRASTARSKPKPNALPNSSQISAMHQQNLVSSFGMTNGYFSSQPMRPHTSPNPQFVQTLPVPASTSSFATPTPGFSGFSLYHGSRSNSRQRIRNRDTTDSDGNIEVIQMPDDVTQRQRRTSPTKKIDHIAKNIQNAAKPRARPTTSFAARFSAIVGEDAGSTHSAGSGSVGNPTGNSLVRATIYTNPPTSSGNGAAYPYHSATQGYPSGYGATTNDYGYSAPAGMGSGYTTTITGLTSKPTSAKHDKDVKVVDYFGYKSVANPDISHGNHADSQSSQTRPPTSHHGRPHSGARTRTGSNHPRSRAASRPHTPTTNTQTGPGALRNPTGAALSRPPSGRKTGSPGKHKAPVNSRPASGWANRSESQYSDSDHPRNQENARYPENSRPNSATWNQTWSDPRAAAVLGGNMGGRGRDMGATRGPVSRTNTTRAGTPVAGGSDGNIGGNGYGHNPSSSSSGEVKAARPILYANNPGTSRGVAGMGATRGTTGMGASYAESASFSAGPPGPAAYEGTGGNTAGKYGGLTVIVDSPTNDNNNNNMTTTTDSCIGGQVVRSSPYVAHGNGQADTRTAGTDVHSRPMTAGPVPPRSNPSSSPTYASTPSQATQTLATSPYPDYNSSVRASPNHGASASSSGGVGARVPVQSAHTVMPMPSRAPETPLKQPQPPSYPRPATVMTRIQSPQMDKHTGQANANNGSTSGGVAGPSDKPMASTPLPNDMSGYHFLEVLGEGTFGTVRKAVHIRTGLPVAIKTLERVKMSNAGDSARVAREIELLRRVDHANVVALYDVIETSQAIYLIMEYCPRGPLFDYIVSKGRLTEREACACLHHILNGLDHIHSRQVTHRDLKPENLLLSDSLTIKIADLGLGNKTNAYSDGLLRTACGSPCYAAPEMLHGRKYVGPQADMWSLGVVLFALICGYLPFEHPNTSKLYTLIKQGTYTVPAHVSAGARDLLSRLLNVNPQMRWNAAKVRAHPWFLGLQVHTDPAGYVDRTTELDYDAYERYRQCGGGSCSAAQLQSKLHGKVHDADVGMYLLCLAKVRGERELREVGMQNHIPVSPAHKRPQASPSNTAAAAASASAGSAAGTQAGQSGARRTSTAFTFSVIGPSGTASTASGSGSVVPTSTRGAGSSEGSLPAPSPSSSYSSSSSGVAATVAPAFTTTVPSSSVPGAASPPYALPLASRTPHALSSATSSSATPHTLPPATMHSLLSPTSLAISPAPSPSSSAYTPRNTSGTALSANNADPEKNVSIATTAVASSAHPSDDEDDVGSPEDTSYKYDGSSYRPDDNAAPITSFTMAPSINIDGSRRATPTTPFACIPTASTPSNSSAGAFSYTLKTAHLPNNSQRRGVTTPLSTPFPAKAAPSPNHLDVSRSHTSHLASNAPPTPHSVASYHSSGSHASIPDNADASHHGPTLARHFSGDSNSQSPASPTAARTALPSPTGGMRPSFAFGQAPYHDDITASSSSSSAEHSATATPSTPSSRHTTTRFVPHPPPHKPTVLPASTRLTQYVSAPTAALSSYSSSSSATPATAGVAVTGKDARAPSSATYTSTPLSSAPIAQPASSPSASAFAAAASTGRMGADASGTAAVASHGVGIPPTSHTMLYQSSPLAATTPTAAASPSFVSTRRSSAPTSISADTTASTCAATPPLPQPALSLRFSAPTATPSPASSTPKHAMQPQPHPPPYPHHGKVSSPRAVLVHMPTGRSTSTPISPKNTSNRSAVCVLGESTDGDVKENETIFQAMSISDASTEQKSLSSHSSGENDVFLAKKMKIIS